MRAGAARGHVGHFHEAGFYGSDAEFAALIVPFVEEGVAAGEPVIIGYDDRKAGLLRSWLADPSAVEFIADRGLYATPARAIATYRRLFEFHAAMGAAQIRIAGDVPHPGNGGRFDGWDRYESAVNTVWQDFPVWGRCLYDTTTAPPAVLEVVERTHPRLVSPSGQRRASERYQQAPVFEGLPPAPDPLEASTPLVELTGRPAADTRHVLAQIGRSRVAGRRLQRRMEHRGRVGWHQRSGRLDRIAQPVLEVERREHFVVGVVQSAQARAAWHARGRRHPLCQSPARRADYRLRSTW